MLGLLLTLLVTWLAHAREVEPIWEQVPAPVMATSPAAVAYSADGRTFVLASDGTLQGWDLGSREPRWSVSSGAPIARALATAHRARVVVVGGDSGRVEVFDLDTGAKLRELGRLSGWVSDVAIAPDDGLVAAVDLSGDLGLWTLDGRAIALPEPAERPVRLEAVRFTPDGRRLVIAGNLGSPGALAVIDLATGQRTAWRASAGPGRSYGQALSISADGGRVALGYWGGTVEVRDLSDGGVYWSDRLSENWIADVRWLSDDRRVLAVGPESLAVFDAASGERVAHRAGPRMDDLSVAPDESSLLGVSMVQARVHRLVLPSLESLDDPREVVAAIDGLAFSPDGTVLAAASSTGAHVIFRSADRGRELARLQDVRCTGMGGVRWDRQGRHVLHASCDYAVGLSVRAWPSLEPVRGLESLPSNGEGWFTSDGEHLVVMDAFAFQSPRVYRIDRGREVSPDAVDPRWIEPLNTPHRDVALALAGHRSVLITHWLNQAQPVPPAVTAGSLNGAGQIGGYTTDGTTTVTVQGDAIVRRSGEVVDIISLTGLQPRSVALSPDGRRVAVGFADGAVRVYAVEVATGTR